MPSGQLNMAPLQRLRCCALYGAVQLNNHIQHLCRLCSLHLASRVAAKGQAQCHQLVEEPEPCFTSGPWTESISTPTTSEPFLIWSIQLSLNSTP
mmetsp:Transcript_39656/g.90181  ORF Transcript_39656/g.90181 Transcript_39656/m.90181 type:complete len:95 (-) Transcript_39656:875-1159(-)